MYLFDAVVPEQAMADAVTGNESVPIQLARCWLPGLAISSAKM